MTIKAVFFDLGGVILRTEYQAPRQHLAERLGMEYEDLSTLVFGGETATKRVLEGSAKRNTGPLSPDGCTCRNQRPRPSVKNSSPGDTLIPACLISCAACASNSR